ncbi:uncharacterized protein LOC126995281 [Eriocheir sinensis]|uniref:uncharacterized protein LOC126995281 n=1 Tax=Eriocheir sinensis TaxID=95602 RepID=UPI0021C6E4AF|nr:uncharacterized protein LOC126995281 [Eriocheir sinensis]
MEGVQSGCSETVLVDSELPLEDTHPAADPAAAARPTPAPRRPTRRRLDFPVEAGLTPAQQCEWFAFSSCSSGFLGLGPGVPSTFEFPPLPGKSTPAAPASSAATPVPRQTSAPAPQPQPTVPPVPAASPPAVAGSNPVLNQILAAVTQLQEALAATISRVAALEQRVSTSQPARELLSIPAPAPSSAPAPCPALQSAGEAMDVDSGDSVVPLAGQMPTTPATPLAVKTEPAKGTAEPRHSQTGPSPSPADPPPQWEATLQVLLAQFASLTQQVAELHHRITPLLERQPPPPDHGG